MPWTPSEASGKTRKANTPSKRSQWSRTANAVLRDSGDEGKAIRIANYAVKRGNRSDQRKDSKRSNKR